jgi:hypothetical protein
MKIKLTLDKLEFRVSLLTEAAPLTCRALLAALPIELQVIHAMWSGHQLIATPIDLHMSTLENPIAMTVPGDVLYHQHHQEIAIVYGEAQFREPIGPVYVTRMGRVEGDLEALATLGDRVQLEGAKGFRLFKEST